MRLSGDGGRVAFLMIGNGASHIGFGDRLLARFDSSLTVGMPVTLSLDGSTLALRLTDTKVKRDRFFVIGFPDLVRSSSLFGAPRLEYEAAGLPVLSADGSGLAYWIQKGNRFAVVARGTETGWFDDVCDPAFSLDGSTAAYAACTAGSWTLVCGPKSTPLPRKPTRLFVSADGSRAGAVVFSRPGRGGGYRVVVDGRLSDEFEEVGQPLFSPDGAHVAYRARRSGRWMLVVDDVMVSAAGIVGDPAFLDGGTTVAYGAQVGRDLWWRTTPADDPAPVDRFADRFATVAPPERITFNDIDSSPHALSPILGRVDLVHREDSPCCTGGRCRGARSPAVVDLDAVRGANADYRRAKSLDTADAAFHLLMQRALVRFDAALRSAIDRSGHYDTIFAKGAIRLSDSSRASGIPDLTPAVLKALREGE